MTLSGRCAWTVVAAGLAFIPGCFGGMYLNRQYGPPIREEQSYPLPHHIPKSPGAVAFRFAMAHDVIHERFPKHGPAFYRERERLARAKLANLPADSDEAFDLTDDIAAGMDRLGQPADAVPLMRKKLEVQEKRGLSGRQLYTTYANLGTFLVHANMKAAMGGDATARANVQEGLEFIKKSIAVNPDAHFGRETWQLAIGQFILAALSEPKLLTMTDCIGDRLDREFPPAAFGPMSAGHVGRGFARPYNDEGLFMGADYLSQTRSSITRAGQEPESGEPDPYRKDGAPFDEPMLGIIGMWRQGGGANPHFALCVGEVMLRVGQRRIAWTAFERAGRLADRYWPDPAKQQFLREHCRRRQQFIESTLPVDEVAELRPLFEAELAYGERYQREYQEYEAKHIAAGADIHDEHFFDDFHRDREPIATTPGSEEWLVVERFPFDRILSAVKFAFSGGLFTSGLTALLAAVWLRRQRG